jgi:hypothetical protein
MALKRGFIADSSPSVLLHRKRLEVVEPHLSARLRPPFPGRVRRSTRMPDTVPPAIDPLEWKLEQEYVQVNENFRRLAEVRFKLLAFVPTLGGIAVYVLATAGLSAEDASRQPTTTSYWLIVFIATAGFFATLGIIFYDQRNSELYNALIHRAKFLEKRFKLPASPDMPKAVDVGGQFNERPDRNRHLFEVKAFEIAHDKGLAIIYGPVLGAWFFPFSLAILNLTGYAANTSFGLACLVAVSAGILFTWELIRQDNADRERWRAASTDTEV